MLKVTATGDRALIRQVQLLRLPPAKRKKLLKRIAREAIKKTRENIKKQRTITGQPMAKRKVGNRKVLEKIAKGNRVKDYTGPNKTTVTFPKSRNGKIARAHQEGFTQRGTAKQAEKAGKRRGEPNYDDDATAEQADALLKAGYKRKTGGRYKSGSRKGQARTKKVSRQWIMENMKVGQAGLILRTLRNEENPAKAWDIKIPARPFFGYSRRDVPGLIDGIADEILKDVKRKT